MKCLCPWLRSARRSFYRTFLVLSIALPLHARAIDAWVVSSSEKVRPSAQPGATTSAALSAARNEFEAFQVAVRGPARAVSVSATAVSGPGTIAAPLLYREALIDLAHPSGPDGATGPFPDALVPDVDDVVGERRNAFPFDVPDGETRAVWVELHVPSDAAPGVYQGNVVVHAAGQPDVVVPISLTVWDFALPSTSSLRSHFGLYYGDLVTAHGVSGDALSRLRARYAQLGLDHRISLGGVDDGNRSLDHFAQFYGALVDGTAPTQLVGARLTSVQFMGSRTSADYASWTSFFKARGWFDRLFDYTCDEPPATCAWSDIPARNQMIKAADPAFRTLVTATVQDAQANGVLSSIDLLTPIVNWMDDRPGLTYSGTQRPSYDAFLASGPTKELWMYQSCMSHGCGGTSDYFGGWVSYAIDASGVRSRGMEWLSFLWGVTGELYWETTYAFSPEGSTPGDPWNDQWRFGGNGDGNLLYPGTPARIGGQSDIPVASIRLKMLREGMEDFEYLKALAAAGDAALARSIAGRLFPNPWTMPASADLLAARDQIAHRILELTGKLSPPPAAGAPPLQGADPTPPAATDPVASGQVASGTAGSATGAAADPAPATGPAADPAPATGPADPSPTAVAAPATASPSTVTGAAPAVGPLAASAGGGCSAGATNGLLTLLGLAGAALVRRRR